MAYHVTSKNASSRHVKTHYDNEENILNPLHLDEEAFENRSVLIGKISKLDYFVKSNFIELN